MTKKKRNGVGSEDSPAYVVPPRDGMTDDEILDAAHRIAVRRLENAQSFVNPAETRRYLEAKYRRVGNEEFGVMYLDSQHRLRASEVLFRGTIDGASVYPREVVKAAIANNAAALILFHNHPSGGPEPSSADRAITRRLVDALALIDVRVLDHIVVGAAECVSFAERGLI